MHKLTALSAAFIFSLTVFSQPVTKTSRYIIPPAQEAVKQLVFTMPFGKADIISISGDTASLRDAGDLVIDVVCTEYPANLSLSKLNNQRVENFFTLFPYLHKTQVAQLNIYRQLDGSEKQHADTMFHGLVVQYRAKQTAETTKRDVAKLEEMLEPAPIPEAKTYTARPAEPVTSLSGTSAGKPAAESGYKEYSKSLVAKRPASQWLEMTITPDATTASGRKKINFGGINVFVPSSNLRIDSPVTITPREALAQKIISPAQYNAFKTVPKIIIVVTKPPPPAFPGVASAEKEVFRETGSPGGDSSVTKTRFTPKYPYSDSSLFTIIRRNNWKNITVIGDVTGSMYPYIGQLLLWIRINSLDSLATHYVFFNDGDNLPDDKKTPGETGGVYGADCNTFDEVLTLVKATMMKGSGGDTPENDIEALLYGEKTFPSASCQVLIADNWAPVRDMRLAGRLTKPVKVVLFGNAYTRVNVDYLNIARKSKGSLHLANQDITNLAALNEGQVLTVNSYVYKVIKGEFVDMNKP